MERTLLGFVWAHAKREQSFIIMLSLASFPITLAALYIPKLIVNDVLQNESFPIQAVGYEFGQIGYLAALCTVLFTLIAANSALRYVINMLCGLSGERLLRRLRYTIYDRTTRMPLPRLKAISVGEIVQAVTAEVEEIGAFCYEIIIKPVYQGGQLLVYLGFILFQDPILGLAAIILFPIQAFVVPTIQRIIVDLVQQRIRKIREISVQIADAIEGVDAMHLNDARLWHLAGVSNNLYDSFRLRFLIFRLRFSVKFANDVINQITPFVFYAIGGYLVIEGRMDLGALIAIIAAYKDVAAPWRDLLIYYQDFTDNSAQYEALYAKYGRDRLPDEETARSEPPRLAGRRISLSNLRPAGRERGLTAELRPGETTLVVGPADRGRTALLRTLAGLEPAEAGALRIDGSEAPVSALIEARGQLAMVTRAAAALPGTFRDNVAYGLYRAPRGGGETAEELLRAREAEKTGAIDAPRDADWIDYARAGVAGAAAFDARALDVLRALELEEELYSRGLWSRAQVGAEAGAATALAEAARAARVRLGEKGRIEALSEMVEFWDFERFHDNATLAENLFFGVPDAGFGDLEAFVRAPETQEALRTARIGAELAKIGLEAAETLRDLALSLGQDTRLLDRLGLMRRDEVEEVGKLIAQARRRGVREMHPPYRYRLQALALALIPSRHRLGVLDDRGRRARIVAARRRLRAAGVRPGGLGYFDEARYLPGAPLIENVLGGRARLDRRDAAPAIEFRIEDELTEIGARDLILRTGLSSPVGGGGAALTAPQLRKLTLARALMARPAVLILDGLGVDDGPEDEAARRAVARFAGDAAKVIGADTESAHLDAAQVVRLS